VLLPRLIKVLVPIPQNLVDVLKRACTAHERLQVVCQLANIAKVLIRHLISALNRTNRWREDVEDIEVLKVCWALNTRQINIQLMQSRQIQKSSIGFFSRKH